MSVFLTVLFSRSAVPLCLFIDTIAYSTRASCASRVVVHQFVGSALFAAGNLHHPFNQKGSASSPKHSATIGKPRGQQHGPAQAAASCRPDSQPCHHTVCLSSCQRDGLLYCTLYSAVPVSTLPCDNTQAFYLNPSICLWGHFFLVTQLS